MRQREIGKAYLLSERDPAGWLPVIIMNSHKGFNDTVGWTFAAGHFACRSEGARSFPCAGRAPGSPDPG